MEKRHLQPAVHDHLAIGLADAFGQVQQNTGMPFSGLRQEVDRQRGRTAEGHEADGHTPGKRIPGCRRIRLRLLHLPKDNLRMAIHRMSRIGHADALLAADQQLLAEMFLQCRKLLAEGRLGDVQKVRRSRDAAAVDDHDEGSEASDVHEDRGTVLICAAYMFADAHCFCNATPAPEPGTACGTDAARRCPASALSFLQQPAPAP